MMKIKPTHLSIMKHYQKSLITTLIFISNLTLIKPTDAASIFVVANGNSLDTNVVNDLVLEQEEEITFTIKLNSMDTSIRAINYGVLVNNAELLFISSEESGGVLGHPFTTVTEIMTPSTPPIFETEFSYTNPIGGVVPLNTTFDLAEVTFQGTDNIIDDDEIDFQIEVTSATILVNDNLVILDTPEELDDFFSPLQQQVSIQPSIPEPSSNFAILTLGSLSLTLIFKRYLKTLV